MFCDWCDREEHGVTDGVRYSLTLCCHAKDHLVVYLRSEGCDSQILGGISRTSVMCSTTSEASKSLVQRDCLVCTCGSFVVHLTRARCQSQILGDLSRPSVLCSTISEASKSLVQRNSLLSRCGNFITYLISTGLKARLWEISPQRPCSTWRSERQIRASCKETPGYIYLSIQLSSWIVLAARPRPWRAYPQGRSFIRMSTTPTKASSQGSLCFLYRGTWSSIRLILLGTSDLGKPILRIRLLF